MSSVSGLRLLKPQRSFRLWGPTAAHSSCGGDGGRGLVLTVRVWLKGPGPISFSARICRLRERARYKIECFNKLSVSVQSLVTSILDPLQMISLHLNVKIVVSNSFLLSSREQKRHPSTFYDYSWSSLISKLDPAALPKVPSFVVFLPFLLHPSIPVKACRYLQSRAALWPFHSVWWHRGELSLAEGMVLHSNEDLGEVIYWHPRIQLL